MQIYRDETFDMLSSDCRMSFGIYKDVSEKVDLFKFKLATTLCIKVARYMYSFLKNRDLQF